MAYFVRQTVLGLRSFRVIALSRFLFWIVVVSHVRLPYIGVGRVGLIIMEIYYWCKSDIINFV